MNRPLALVSCAVLLLASHVAQAKPKVALTQIDGDASGDVRDAVAEALEGKELALIGSKEVNRAVDKLGDPVTENDFKKLASALEADAIVTGKLDKKGSARTLKFRLFVHKKMAKGFTVSFKDAKSEKFRSALHDKMLDKIGVAPGSGDDDDDARPSKSGKASAADDDDDPLATKKDAKDAKAQKAAKTQKGTKKGKAAPADDDDDAKPATAKKGKAAPADDDDDARPASSGKKGKLADDDARPSKKAKAVAADDDDDARPARKAKPDDDSKAGSDDDARSSKADAADDDSPRKAKKKVAAADDDAAAEATVEVRPEPVARSTNRPALRLDLGGAELQRSFTFSARALTDSPKNTKLPAVAGMRVAVELYPLALSDPGSGLARLGIAADYDRTLKLNLDASQMPGVAIPTKESDYSVGLRYRMPLGSAPTSATLTFGAGYGKRLFSPDASKITDPAAAAAVARDVPAIDYAVIDPGATLRLPLGRLLAFSLGAEGLLITSAGSIQNSTSYGRARVYGFDGTAALDVMFSSHFALRIAADFLQINYTFQNGGALANNVDGDPTTADVTGLTDRSLSATATLGILY